MRYLPGSRVKLIAEWSHVQQIGTVREAAQSTGIPTLGILYLVEWDMPATVARSVIRESELAPVSPDVDEMIQEAHAWLAYIMGERDDRPAAMTRVTIDQTVGHVFEPSYTGMVCSRMVLDNFGDGDACGKLASDPIHIEKGE